jgi:hypothetical protein
LPAHAGDRSPDARVPLRPLPRKSPFVSSMSGSTARGS